LNFYPLVESVAKGTKTKFNYKDRVHDYLISLIDHFPDHLRIEETSDLRLLRNTITGYIVGQRGRILNKSKSKEKHLKEYSYGISKSEKSKLWATVIAKDIKQYLSERDVYIIDRLSEGYTFEDIASKLKISKQAVSNNVKVIVEIVNRYNAN
jgi:predicted transcriptional regulator